MKRFNILLICIFSFINIFAQEPSFRKEYQYINNEISFSLDFGAATLSELHNKFIMMGSVSVYGVYLDIGGFPRMHDNDPRLGTWDDNTVFAMHAGYKIPITKYFNIIPLIGYYEHDLGLTDGYDKYYDYYYGDIYNEFYVYDSFDDVDYGCKVEYKIPIAPEKYFTIDWTYTRYMMYGGIGMQFKF